MQAELVIPSPEGLEKATLKNITEALFVKTNVKIATYIEKKTYASVLRKRRDL